MNRSAALGRGFAVGLALFVGAATGFVLTFTHRQYSVELAGAGIPLGLVGGLAIVAALLAGMRLAFENRLIPLAAGIGITGATALLALPGAGGSLLVVDDPVGYAWAFGPPILALVVVAWPARSAGSRGGGAVAGGGRMLDAPGSTRGEDL